MKSLIILLPLLLTTGCYSSPNYYIQYTAWLEGSKYYETHQGVKAMKLNDGHIIRVYCNDDSQYKTWIQ